jgi:hypothetical protein
VKIRLEFREESATSREGYWLSMIDSPMTYRFPVTLDLFDSMPSGVHELEVSLPANVRVNMDLISPLMKPSFDPRTPPMSLT